MWQILLSIVFLGRRYKVNQLLGCFLVTIGVVVTVARSVVNVINSFLDHEAVARSVVYVFNTPLFTIVVELMLEVH